MSRPKHRYPDYENLLKEVEKRGWRVEGGGNRHFKVKCPSPCKCMSVISSTPSKRQTMLTLKAQLSRETCWEAP